ncbi:hypothetical protein IQ279_09730 [Streptomyces verrucosisporus]|uniref:hypothetical protein n=1 Tax=Streptomyces verrucosisporus TaxID=1695161 RepID=UPI0019D1BAB6|nr:hypothetical protein [Streptomyces verrucosisporus]MBN3929916.1 hypothetical protein [Streptomyces verrucosisporus]
MTETVVLILGLVVAPIAALALLTWGLNGTVWLLDHLAGRRRPAARTVRWRAPETNPGAGAGTLPR